MRLDVEVKGRKIAAVSAADRGTPEAGVVIDCRKSNEIPADEAKPAEGGPKVVHLPMTAATLSEQDMDQLRRELARAEGPFEVVSTNGRRAAAAVLAHAGRVLGWKPAEALAKCPAVGEHPHLSTFVNRYLDEHADRSERKDGDF